MRIIGRQTHEEVDEAQHDQSHASVGRVKHVLTFARLEAIFWGGKKRVMKRRLGKGGKLKEEERDGISREKGAD